MKIRSTRSQLINGSQNQRLARRERDSTGQVTMKIKIRVMTIRMSIPNKNIQTTKMSPTEKIKIRQRHQSSVFLQMLARAMTVTTVNSQTERKHSKGQPRTRRVSLYTSYPNSQESVVRIGLSLSKSVRWMVTTTINNGSKSSTKRNECCSSHSDLRRGNKVT